MKNKEFFKKELEEIMVKGKSFGIHETTGNLIGCFPTSCASCAFKKTTKMCMELRQEWLEQEHVEEDKWKDFRHLEKGDLIEIRLEDGWYFRIFDSIDGNEFRYSNRPEESFFSGFTFTISDPSRVRLPEFKEKEYNKEKKYYDKWKNAEAACKRLSDYYKDLMERFNERGHKIHRLRMDLELGKVNNEHKVQTLTQLKDVNDILIGKLKDQLSDAKVQIETLNKDFEAQRKLNENQQVMIRELRERLERSLKNGCDQCHRNDILKYENKELKGKLSEIENVLAKKTGNKHDDIADSISYSLRSKKEVKGEKTFTNVNCNSFIGLKYGPKDLW